MFQVLLSASCVATPLMPRKPYGVGSMIPILQIRKVKHRKANKFDKVTQLASKWHSEDLGSASLAWCWHLSLPHLHPLLLCGWPLNE